MLTATATERTLRATMARVVTALVALLAAGTSVLAAPAGCPDGRYEVVRHVPSASYQVAVENGTITWGLICPPVKASFVVSHRGTRIRASWPSCGEGRFGRINLVARIDPSCTTMRGVTRDPKTNIAHHFVATRLP